MRLSTHKYLYFLGIAVTSAGCSQEVSFQKDVNPILQENCLSCHDGKGEGVEASGFSVRSYDDLMKGTKFGQVVVPGDSLSSSLYRLIDHQADPKIQMPPHHDEALSAGKMQSLSGAQINTIKAWIDQGAKNN
ncbi:MAG: hypothetical protein JSW45_04500 [Thiotrichales bacterium]|nr:MAG: hypothetical protein JSW45_04500 [Thiotrichales bacterium]